MEESRLRIRKTGRIIKGIIFILKIALVIAIIAGLGIAGSALLDDNVVTDFHDMFEDNNAFLVDMVANLDGVSLKTQLVISGAMFALTMAILLVAVFRIGKVLGEMVDGDTPFTDHLASELKKMSWFMLIFLVYDIFVAIIAFLLVKLFAYIFEYGAYIQKRADETNKIQEEMILSFAEITENKSGQTGKHVRRVAEYSKILALELGLDTVRADQLRLASTMHDVGKLLIPKEILEKPGRLTDDEFAEIKKHTTYGGDLLDHVEGDVMKMARTVALEHHERPDGRGYPSSKALDDISIEGKIVAVADVYDALTSRRSYKEAWDDTKAYDEIVKGKGTQFDTKVVEAFERVYEKINQARQELQD
ncbi:MAG: HD-GYP domain-containing protein [Clostridiales bacterium]|nr:HD-GYP domain-containing protein [Clostridiales bacterium]